jgi:putative transposase
MPDHFHVLLTPAKDKTLERCVQMIKGGSAHAIRIERSMTFPVWQRGFSDHRIRDDVDWASHVRYIELNPVKARLVLDRESIDGRRLLERSRWMKSLRG